MLRDRSFSIALVQSDRFNTWGSKSVIQRIAIVGAISDNSFGASHGDNLIEGSINKGDFMWADRRRVLPEWKTGNNHKLRTLANTTVSSMKHSERSIGTTSSRCRVSASSIRRSTPLLLQNRRKHIAPEVRCSCESRHAASVRSPDGMPVMTACLLCNSGRPPPLPRRIFSAISDAGIAHCSSVSSCLRAIRKS
jgi:hypothetical protein